MKQTDFLKGKEFSLILGGPFFQFLRKAHLTGDALELVKFRVLILSLFTWLPLLLLSMLTGNAWSTEINLPFIKDFDTHIRFLVVVPLLIMAELIVHQRMIIMVNQFQEHRLIPEAHIDQFTNAISSAIRLRNSAIAEVSIVILIYVIGYQFVWQQSAALNTSTWYIEASATDQLSPAGIWFRFASLPIFQFLLLRWYYRIFIWTRFLYQVARIPLRLVATHPDDAGGLGFLNNTIYAFMPLALAHGALLSGMLSNHIFYEGAQLIDYKIPIAIVVAFVMSLVILPMFSFSSQLAEAKRKGSREYGELASRYVQEFDDQWIKRKGNSKEALLGTPDIQALADLANSYNVVKNMQFIPIHKQDILMLAVLTLAPVLPLFLTMMPLGELIKMLSGVIF